MLVRFFKIFRKGLIIVFLALMVGAVVPAFLPLSFSDGSIGMQFGVDTAWGAGKVGWVIDKASDLSGVIATLVSWLLVVGIQMINALFELVINWVWGLFDYQNVSQFEAVGVGWKIMRDFCNGLFVVALLIISFATILRIENYAMKNAMPKILIMAVLINFSKTITLFLIDISNVVMMTFVNAVGGDRIGSNLVKIIGIHKITTFSSFSDIVSAQQWDLLIAITLMFVFYIVALIAITSIVIMLIGRVVALMILVVLSPLAFTAYAIPKMQGHFSKWSGELSKQLTTGPVLAFFLWFAITVMLELDSTKALRTAADDEAARKALIEMAKLENSLGFVLAIALLAMAIKTAASSGVAGAAIGGKLLSKAEAMGKGALKWGVKKVPGVQTAIDVKDMTKQYFADRAGSKEKKRKERIERGAAAIGGTIGEVQDLLVSSLGVRSLIDRATGRTENDRRQQEINNLQTEQAVAETQMEEATRSIEARNVGFTAGRFTSHDGVHRYDRDANGNWMATNMRTGIGYSLNNTEIVEARDDENITAQADITRLQGGVAARTASIQAEQNQLSNRRRSQQRLERFTRSAMNAGVLGALTGGVGGLMAGGVGLLAGGVSGYIDARSGAPSLMGRLRDAGQTDMRTASNYAATQTNAERENVRNESNGNVRAILDDESRSDFTRMAALMESMDRRLLSLNDAQERFRMLKQRLDGTGANERWRNRALGGRMDATLERNYPGLTQVFTNLAGGAGVTPIAQQRAQQEIRERYENGTYTLENATMDTIRQSMQQMVEGISVDRFVSQFNRLDRRRQRELITELRNQRTAASRERLARVSGVGANTFNITNPDQLRERNEFIASLTPPQLQEIIDNAGQQLTDLQGAVNNNVNMFNDAVQRSITGNTQRGRSILSAFTPPANP